MRKFSSYGPVDTGLHYYAPRQRLIDTIVRHVVGDDPERDGHEANRTLYETPYQDVATGVLVEPVLVTTVE